MTGIARLADVRRPAVSNWRRRHADFPRPHHIGGAELFLAADVANWLSRRTIKTNDLRPGEREGLSYGDRFRRNLGIHDSPAESAALPPPQRSFSQSTVDSEETQTILWTLWRGLDALRGSMDLTAYRDLVLSLLYLRVTNTRAWADLRRAGGGLGGQSKLGDLPDYAIRRLPDEVQPASGLIRGVEGQGLSRVIDVIDRADLGESPERSGAAPRGAAAYRYLLGRFAAAEGRHGADYFTPDSVVRLAVDLTAPERTDRVYDPFCRSGGLLVGAAMHSPRSGAEQAGLRIFGQEPNYSSWALARMNLAIHGAVADLGQGPTNALVHDLHAAERFDVVLSNPPFNMSHWAQTQDLIDDSRWRYGLPPLHNANFAWLQHALAGLSQNGRAAVLMANGAASTAQPKELAIRAAMIEAGVIDCIVALPSQLFHSTAIPVTLWLLRPPSTEVTRDVLFVDARSAGMMVDRTHRVLTQEDIGSISIGYHEWRTRRAATPRPGLSRSATINEVRESGYVLNPGRYIASPAARGDVGDAFEAVRRLRQELDDLSSRATGVDTSVARELRRVDV